ncbi:MAG: maleate cis-trans isomerase family protein [Geminicoccaceae bacterium]
MVDDPRRGHKIGVLVPYTNVNLEPDMIMMCPKGCTMHFERLGDYDVDAVPGSDQMAGLGAADMSEALRLIKGARPTAVLYGCTSATLTHGVAFDRDLSAKIRDRLGAVSLTAAGSLLRGIRALGATKVGFASPYIGDINDHAARFLADEGIETVMQADIGRALGNYEQGELTPKEVFDLAMRADGPSVEAIVLSCTDMRAVEAVERIEASTGKPVVTSNQAMILALCHELNLPRPNGAPGRLFERL